MISCSDVTSCTAIWSSAQATTPSPRTSRVTRGQHTVN
jgi:hypothetical protein